MQKVIIAVLALLFIFTLAACGAENKTNSTAGDNYDGDQMSSFGGTVIEIGETYLLVEPDADSNEAKSADRISVSLNNTGVVYAKVGDRVVICYRGGIAESYPAQISDVISVDVWYDWGIILTAINISSDGITLVCNQTGGSVTGELNTGEDYFLEVLTENGWEDVPTVIDNYGWDSIAYIVNMNGETEWDINWEWLYGKVVPGTYRIGKSFMDFRGTGDYDTAVFYAEFVITE